MTKENIPDEQIVEVVDRQESRRASGRFREGAYEYSEKTAKEFRKNLLWAGFGTLFIFFLAVFVFIALIITVLFWLLPVAFAAFVAAGVVILALAAYRALRTIFKK